MILRNGPLYSSHKCCWFWFKAAATFSADRGEPYRIGVCEALSIMPFNIFNKSRNWCVCVFAKLLLDPAELLAKLHMTMHDSLFLTAFVSPASGYYFPYEGCTRASLNIVLPQ
jgi:hypothetical protein